MSTRFLKILSKLIETYQNNNWQFIIEKIKWKSENSSVKQSVSLPNINLKYHYCLVIKLIL